MKDACNMSTIMQAYISIATYIRLFGLLILYYNHTFQLEKE